MKARRVKFPLNSDQLELLLAFEDAPGLSELALVLRRDASVISRALQRLAEDAPVLEKEKGRWRLTHLGRRVNESSRRAMGELSAALKDDAKAVLPYRSQDATLIIVNGQRTMLTRGAGAMSTPDAIVNAAKLLRAWRSAGRPIIHAKHVSRDPASAFFPGQVTAEFIADLAPAGLPRERVVEKNTASVFTGTKLDVELDQLGVTTLVVAGFTANECVDATVKQASDLGFRVYVAEDAVAMFDIVTPDGRVFPAAKTQQALLASLQAGFAELISTETLTIS